jgi:hypothetical protein
MHVSTTWKHDTRSHIPENKCISCCLQECFKEAQMKKRGRSIKKKTNIVSTFLCTERRSIIPKEQIPKKSANMLSRWKNQTNKQSKETESKVRTWFEIRKKARAQKPNSKICQCWGTFWQITMFNRRHGLGLQAKELLWSGFQRTFADLLT